MVPGCLKFSVGRRGGDHTQRRASVYGACTWNLLPALLLTWSWFGVVVPGCWVDWLAGWASLAGLGWLAGLAGLLARCFSYETVVKKTARQNSSILVEAQSLVVRAHPLPN